MNFSVSTFAVAAGRKKPRGPNSNGRTRIDRAELRQKKYRYLYQVRTAHGDVISQVNMSIFIFTYFCRKMYLLSL